MTRTLAFALLAGTALVPAAVHAQTLPTGGTVAAGQASISTPAPGAMTITQASDRAIIDWSSFSIGQGGRVDIAQPSGTAALLNRVTGTATSEIAGQLDANGRVFLVNPNGILITRTGSVNAAGFVASTLDIANKDFMAGSEEVTVVARHATDTVGVVRGGYAGLMQGRNRSALVLAKLGTVETDGRTQGSLDLEGNGFLRVAVPKGGITVAGRITANEVVLTAGTAQDAARGVVNLSGVIAANGVTGRGGTVTLTGSSVTLTGATIDASGVTGGGTVRIGGDRQGIGSLAHATTVNVDAGSVIRADATGAGSGGDVTLWSDGATAFAGTISARGLGGGNGGEAEVSGHDLAYTGIADLTGGAGFGTLLLDPYNVTISTGANSNQSGFTATGNDSVINATTLQNALATANVTISTGASGTQAGNITVAAPVTWSSGSQLTLSAAGSIVVDSTISVAGAGKVALDYSYNDPVTGGLSFARGASIAYADGQSGQALTVNGSPYTLLYTMAQVDAIDGSSAIDGAAVTTYGPGTSGRYALAHDLDASGTIYTGALVASNGINFAGTLEGLGHVVSNLTISRGNYIGLIGLLTGTVRDIGIVGGMISGSGAVGGLVGYSLSGTVSNAYATCAVSGSNYVGGLVGYNDRATVTNSYATGAVTGTSYVGGLVGQNIGTVSNAYATGAVSGSNLVGGLVGVMSGGAVTNAYATGAVSGSNEVGGLVGYNASTIANSYWDTLTSGTTTGVGGGTTTGATGLTTAAFQSGASALGGAFAGGTGGLYPYFASFFPNGVQAISGTAYGSTGAAVAQAQVGVYLSGALIGGGTPSSGANGYYYMIVPAGTLTASGNSIGRTITLSGATAVSGSSYSDALVPDANGIVSGLSVTAGLRSITTANQTWSALASAMSSTFGATTYNGLSSTLGTTAENIVATNAGGFTLDTAQALGAGSFSLTGAGDLTLAASLSTAGTVSLSSAGSIAQTGGTISAGMLTGSAGGSAALTRANAIGTLGAFGTSGGSMSLTDTVALTLHGAVNLGTGTLALMNSGGAITQTGGTITAGTLTGSANGAASFATAGNAIANLATFTTGNGAITVTTGGALGVTGAVTAGNAQAVTLYAGGNLTIASGGSVAGGTLTLATGGNFINQAGTGALSASNRWLIYSADPRLDTLDGLSPGFIQYDAVYGTATPAQSSGNGVLHSLAPVLSVSLTGTVEKIYDGTTAATLASGNYTMSGAIAGDVVRLTLPTSGSYDTADVGTGKTVSASGVAIASATNGAATVYGYRLASTTATGGVGTIDPATLTYVATATSRVYGDANPTLTGTATGFVNGQTQASATTGTLAFSSTARTTSNVGSYAITGSGLSANHGNYVFAQAAGNTTALTVTARPLSVTADAQSRIYGDANPALTYQMGGRGLVNGDPLSGSLATPATTASGVGGYAITQGSLAASGNYAVSYTGNTLAVTARALTVTPDAVSRVYGDANPASGTATGDNLVNGDTVTSVALSSPATTASSVAAYALTGSNTTGSGLSNYAITYATIANGLTVTARPLTVTTDALSRVYGDANPALTYAVGGRGLANGDTLSGALATSATTASGIGGYAITQGSLAASDNYALSYTGNTLTVTARVLTVTPDAVARVYGDANPASGTATGDNLVNGDTITGVALSSPATTASSVGGYSLTGSGANGTGLSNYAITYAALANGLTVTARPLTVTADGQSRTYGTANPALTYQVGGMGLVGGDTLSGSLATVAATGSNVGSYAITQGSVTNAGNPNYAIAYTGASLAVTPRMLTVTASADTKTYDGTTGAAAAPGVSGSFYGSDGGSFSEAYASPNAGAGLTLVPTGKVSDGNGGANYSVIYVNSTNGTISPATLTYTADAASRAYGAANPAFGGTVSGFVAGQTQASATTGTLAFSSPATTGSNVGSYAVIGSGLTANNGNYLFQQAAGNGTALTVVPHLLTVTGERAYDGTTGFATGALTVSAGANSESVTLTGGSGTATSANVGSYANSALSNLAIGVAGGNASAANYALPATGTLVIDPRALTVTANAQTHIYGNANPALTYATTGLVAGDALSGGLATAATPQSGVGVYAITQGSLMASDNYALAYVGNLLTVTPRPLVVTPSPVGRVYGNANPGAGAAGADNLLNGDTVTAVSLSSPATTASGVGSYALMASNAIGSGLGNYAISYAALANGLTVTPRSLIIAAAAQARVYGDANPGLGYTVGGLGLVNGDTLTGAQATAATPQSSVSGYAIDQGSLAASANYQVSYTGATLTVTPRPLTVTADDQARYPGEANPALTFTVGGRGLVNGDMLLGLLATPSTTASAPGLYAILQGSLVATPNYQLTYVPGTLLVGASRFVPLGDRAGTQERDTYSIGTTPALHDGGLTIDTTASTKLVGDDPTQQPTDICPRDKPCRRSN